MSDIKLGTSSWKFFARMREALLTWDASDELPGALWLKISDFRNTLGFSGPWSHV